MSGRSAPPSGPGLHGILVVAKPAALTSHDVVALVRRLAATRRVGHGGTLDPFATGVLPVFLGHATRLAEYHLAGRKAYRATLCFGSSSTTDDLDGELAPAPGSGPSRAAVIAALAPYPGRISQLPPAYSAIKVAGRRAYDLARSGRSPALRPRDVTVDRLELVGWDAADPDRPIAELEIECSAGTYIRALARDIGRAVGSGAYLGALARTASGSFTLADAIGLDAIRAAAASGPAGLEPLLLPIDAGLDRFPRVVLTPLEVGAIAHGQFVRPQAGVPGGLGEDGRVIAVDPSGQPVAVAALRDGRLAPDKVLVELGSAAPAAATGSRAPEPAESAAEPGPTAREPGARARVDVEAALATELDPPTGLDPDPASPDDI